MTQTADGHPAETEDVVPADADHETPDEKAVRSLLEDGPQGPHGRILMAAAGIDVDREYPVDETGDGIADHIGNGTEAEAGLDGRPVTAFVEEGNRWAGDGPVPTAGQELIPNPAHPESGDLVVAARSDASEESATAAGLPVVREPLLSAGEGAAFLDRWQIVQVGFVEDPEQSVRNADALMGEIAAAYGAAFEQRRESLAAVWRQADHGTEDLRQALRQYRSFLGVVLPK